MEFYSQEQINEIVLKVSNIRDDTFLSMSDKEELRRVFISGDIELSFVDKTLAGYLIFFPYSKCPLNEKKQLGFMVDAIRNERVLEMLKVDFKEIEIYENEFTKNLLGIRPNDIYLSSLAVDYRFRGLGIGKELVERCIEKSNSNGSKRFLLECWGGSPNLENFYSRLGFYPILRAERMFEDGNSGIFMGRET
jgi:ribosomal protein S18 acetylase RimI-like enzyme